MKLANERSIGVSTPLPSQLEGGSARLERLSWAPQFSVQRDLALGRALQIYLSTSETGPLAPLPQEVRLAELFLYADFYPEDGQLTLIEQLRDVIPEHIPEEEPLVAVVSIHYVTGESQPYLYAIALYEHREFTYLRDSLRPY
jgi:hypothetical protein